MGIGPVSLVNRLGLLNNALTEHASPFGIPSKKKCLTEFLNIFWLRSGQVLGNYMSEVWDWGLLGKTRINNNAFAMSYSSCVTLQAFKCLNWSLHRNYEGTGDRTLHLSNGRTKNVTFYFLPSADTYMYMFAAMHYIAILSTKSNDSSISCFNKQFRLWSHSTNVAPRPKVKFEISPLNQRKHQSWWQQVTLGHHHLQFNCQEDVSSRLITWRSSNNTNSDSYYR